MRTWRSSLWPIEELVTLRAICTVSCGLILFKCLKASCYAPSYTAVTMGLLSLLRLAVGIAFAAITSFSLLPTTYPSATYESTPQNEVLSFSLGYFILLVWDDDFRSKKIASALASRSKTVYCPWSRWSVYVGGPIIFSSPSFVKTPFACSSGPWSSLCLIIKENTLALWNPVGQYLYCVHNIRYEVLSGDIYHRYLVLLNFYRL